ncbi:hypothetical protein AMTRI_Chr05g59670 [Amborella trichopoda]
MASQKLLAFVFLLVLVTSLPAIFAQESAKAPFVLEIYNIKINSKS